MGTITYRIEDGYHTLCVFAQGDRKASVHLMIVL